MTLSHLSRVVSPLEKAGWVRRTLATLTAEGWDKVVDAAPGHVEAVRRYMFDTLTAEQARILGDAAERIVEAIHPPGSART
jgi:DNA-binding MarR family transcriptional regulator